MTTTDDARLVEIEKRFGGAIAFMGSIATIQGDVRFLLDRLNAAESRIRELEEALTEARDFFESGRFSRVEGGPITALRDKIASALHSDDVQEEGNGG